MGDQPSKEIPKEPLGQNKSSAPLDSQNAKPQMPSSSVQVIEKKLDNNAKMLIYRDPDAPTNPKNKKSHNLLINDPGFELLASLEDVDSFFPVVSNLDNALNWIQSSLLSGTGATSDPFISSFLKSNSNSNSEKTERQKRQQAKVDSLPKIDPLPFLMMARDYQLFLHKWGKIVSSVQIHQLQPEMKKILVSMREAYEQLNSLNSRTAKDAKAIKDILSYLFPSKYSNSDPELSGILSQLHTRISKSTNQIDNLRSILPPELEIESFSEFLANQKKKTST